MKILSATIILGIFGLTGVGCADTNPSDVVLKKEIKTIPFTIKTTKIGSTKRIGSQKDTFYLRIKATLVTPIHPAQNMHNLFLAKK
jgi:hypothetical protein